MVIWPSGALWSIGHMVPWPFGPVTFWACFSNAKVYDVCKQTDLDYAPKLSKSTNNRVLLKREDMQPVYSFKLRGAYNKIVSLDANERACGICACSAGNHARTTTEPLTECRPATEFRTAAILYRTVHQTPYNLNILHKG